MVPNDPVSLKGSDLNNEDPTWSVEDLVRIRMSTAAQQRKLDKLRRRLTAEPTELSAEEMPAKPNIKKDPDHLRRHGWEMTLKEINRFESRFYLDDEDGCWHWTGPVRTTRRIGEPIFVLEGVPRMARRIAFEYYEGPIPIGVQIGQVTCGHLDCINPEHAIPVRISDTTTKGNRAKQFQYNPAITCVNGHLKRIHGSIHTNGNVACHACVRLRRIKNYQPKFLQGRARKRNTQPKAAKIASVPWQQRAAEYLER